jgi:hypothetical protein
MRSTMNSDQCLVTTEDFVHITNMDLTQFYILYISGKLPLVKRPHHVFVDIGDLRARQYLPDYKPMNDLF